MRNALLLAFALACLVALTYPVYPRAAALDLRLFGLPWSLVWNVLWVMLSFFALLAYHLTRPRLSEADQPATPSR